jgi:two-component system nitrogen regulation sensor histidine kinase NtrY
MKFQGVTSLGPNQRRVLWLGVGAVVLLAGEAALQGTWFWLGVVTVASGALAALAWAQQGTGERGLAAGLALLAIAAGIATARTGHAAFHASVLQSEAVRDATRERDRLLQSAIAAANRTATVALDRIGRSPPESAPRLDYLLSSSDLETAIAVIAGDTVIAVAGPHRIQPIMRTTPAALISTPFARMLVIRATRNGRQAHVVLLLDSLPGLPVAGPSLAASSGAWQGVRWAWQATGPLGRPIEYASTEAAAAGVIAAMRPIPPQSGSFVTREQGVARLLVSTGLIALALLILLTATHPAPRIAAILLPLWALARSDVASTQFALTAIRSLLGAAALLLLAILLWRRPARRSVIGLVAAVLLLGTAPPLAVVLANAILPRGEMLSLVTGFGWEAIIALAAGGFLAVAMAPLRARDDERAGARWGLLATGSVLVIGLIGIEAWTPGGWAWWYRPLWLIPIALLLPLTSPRTRLLALATTAGVLASLATWGTSVERRMDLARADLARLDAQSDTAAANALDRFAVEAQQAHATRLDRLYAAWRASSLAREGVPTYLALWNHDGRQREVVALDSLSISWDELAPMVRFAGTEPTRRGFARGVGHHEVLVLPLAPDTIATVTVGPRSRLLSPTTFGLIVGWRSPSSDPPYAVDVIDSSSQFPDTNFHRRGRLVVADRRITSGDEPRIVRATVEISARRSFVVRAALSVLLDIGLVLGAWLLLQRILGQQHTLPAEVFRRSYRRTVTTALMAFFIVPAALFTLSSWDRLRQDAAQQHTAELAGTLRDIEVQGGLAVAEAPRPRSDSLAVIADSANAEIGVYRHGRLIAASDSMLAELGYLPAVVTQARRASVGPDGGTMPPPLPGADLRLGVLDAAPPGTLVVAAIPGGDSGLAREQVDQALRLLLAALGGIIASVFVAGIIARALGKPIETLRRTAVAIGRHEPSPEATDVPAEFVPVFGAITQMENDLRNTEAELRAGRARTAAILSTVATGVIGVDAHGDVIHANPRATVLLAREVVVGERLATQLPGGWRRVADELERLLGHTTHAPQSRELQIDDRRFAVTLAPLGDGGVVLAITDITEASRAARVLAWGEMARQVAHEIKNPLTPMRLGLQHLRRVQADRLPNYPQLVDETAERLLAEIERLDRIARSFARYGAPPERAAALEPIALRPAAEELASLFALSAERPRIEVIGEAAGPVCARREELVQVLLNLLDNARQADASFVRLVLSGYTLRVEDDGGGIPPEQLGRIFEPSFSTTTSGTGLGLAIVRRLVEGWEATVGVESDPGKGAVFTIRFVPGR